MDCPRHDCRLPVFMIKGKLSPVPVGMTPDPATMKQILADVVPNIRSAEKANDWAIRSKWQSLEEFLTDPTQQPRAIHFRSGYWPHINV